jgi:hypothetical protein
MLLIIIKLQKIKFQPTIIKNQLAARRNRSLKKQRSTKKNNKRSKEDAVENYEVSKEMVIDVDEEDYQKLIVQDELLIEKYENK